MHRRPFEGRHLVFIIQKLDATSKKKDFKFLFYTPKNIHLKKKNIYFFNADLLENYQMYKYLLKEWGFVTLESVVCVRYLGICSL